MKKIILVLPILLTALLGLAQKNKDANLLMVVVEGKTGYIDSNGKTVIAPSFAMGSQFCEGVASVVHLSNNKYRYAFINDNMDVVITTMFDAAGDFSEDLARVQVNGKWGYINKKGNLVIDAQYSLCYEFKEGYAQASIKGKWGIINKKGEWIIEPVYQDVTGVNEGVLAIQNKLGGAWKFIDIKGKQIIADSFERAGGFAQGLAPVRKESKWGYINKKGEIVIPYQYSSALSFSANGLASVEKNAFWGFINTKGEVVIDFEFNRGSNFRYNYALVEKGNLYGYINAKGEFTWKTEK